MKQKWLFGPSLEEKGVLTGLAPNYDWPVTNTARGYYFEALPYVRMPRCECCDHTKVNRRIRHVFRWLETSTSYVRLLPLCGYEFFAYH